jgi:hypothetical protein
MGDAIDRVVKEADAFLMGESRVQRTLDAVAHRLDALGIEFALAGGLALGVHGYLRLTVDVDLLVGAGGLAAFKQAWLGRGYVEKFPGSRGVRDAETQVGIDFLIAGEYPGDGRAKAVCFPPPAAFPRSPAGLRVVDLRTLVELKLASGLSAPDRLVDLADVLALIRANHLPEDYAGNLDPSVRAKFTELWRAAQAPSES